ncbi:MAG: type II secretion system protein [Clostridia bacterium]
MKYREKGITLVALVITIVILLILAGIAIAALTGDNGLFSRAQQAKEETIKSQLKEEITMSIQEIQTEELPKGNNVTLKTLAEGQLESKLKDITVELENDEINGEYKDYEYTIDSNLNVTINGAATGVRIKGNAEVQSGYVFEGNTVDIKVTASITEGTITGIEAPEGATIKTDTSATEKVYTVNKNGTYIFKITSDSEKTKNVTANVENILSAPQITISEVKKDSFKINVEDDYPNGAITEYKYSVEGTVKQQIKIIQ